MASNAPHKPQFGALEILKYIGPGLLVTVGFIDPGNWASNVAAGAQYGYTLLWMVTLSTVMLIILQHNVAHLGIATGLCLSEAAIVHLNPWYSRFAIGSAVLAAVSTAVAELLGAAIGLNMIFPQIPLLVCVVLATVFALVMVMTNSYRKLERIIIGFVSLVGVSFVFELILVDVEWGQAAVGWIKPAIPMGALPVIMSVLGAVVMPHNLFLHSEIIQSRQWQLEDEKVIERQLRYEFMDTLFSMGIGWAINSAMILIAAATFFVHHIEVTDLAQAKDMLVPLLGSKAALVFALALLAAGLASSITAAMAGGSIYAGLFKEPFDINDSHSKWGVGITIVGAALVIFVVRMFTENLFMGLIVSQILLSIQLPWTIFTQIMLTSSPKVMGKFANDRHDKILLWIVALVVTALNVMLLGSIFFG
jgi:manganese transport protein